MKSHSPRPVHLKDYRPPAYLIDKVDLSFALDPTRTRVHALLTIRPNPKATGKRSPVHRRRRASWAIPPLNIVTTLGTV